MNELDIEVIKEKYAQYKREHYEDEREMRKLIKMKRLVPNMVNDESWKRRYKRVNSNLSNGLYYYNELKKMLSEEQLKEFTEKVKFNVLKERYVNFKLDRLEDDFSSEVEYYKSLFEEQLTNEEKIIPKVDKFDEDKFAESILEEKELIKKVEVICRYQKSTITVFFDTTAMLKAELARLFIDQMNIENISVNDLITACLVYTFRRTNIPTEIQRIKAGKEEDKNFLKSLGFDESFCKICSEYNRYNESADYERTNEGDILELIDKFVGLVIHREDRLAFPVEEALDVLNTKALDGIENQYKDRFMRFIHDLEKIEVTRSVGVMTFFANSVNKNQRHDISRMIEIILKIRDLIGGPINEHKVMRLERIEKIQDKFSVVQTLQKMILKLKDKIINMSKILKGYKKLSEGNLEKDEGLDR